MSYADSLSKLSREPLNIIEFGFDTAITSGGYERVCDGNVPPDQLFWPCVESIEWVPTRTNLSGGLGYLGEIVVKCKDFLWPSGAGTYFGRLLANNQYYLNRQLKVFVGYYSAGETFDFANFQERRYLIKKITGPDHNGYVKIHAADIISQLQESQAPAVSYGNLSATLTDSYTGVINIGNNEGFSASGGKCYIEDELCAYSGIVSTDQITLSARGEGGTEAAAHDLDDPVRVAYHYSGNAVDCVRDLIENFSEIDHASYIPDADWNSERDNFLSSENVELWITEPTELNKLIDKIGKQTFTNIWWDDAAQEIKLKAIGPTLTSSISWNDSENILAEKVSIKRDQRQIVTQVWIYYGKRDQSKGDDADNYESLYVKVDAAAETGLGQPKIKKIFADFLPSTGGATASKIASRIISQHSKPIEITLFVDAKDSAVDVGDPVDITTDLYQGIDGLPEPIKLRVIEKAQAENSRYKYRFSYSGVEVGSRYFVIAPNDVPDYDSATDEQKAKYGWIADATDNVGAADDDPYLIL